MPGYRKLGRTSSQRKAMLRALSTQLIYHGSITTTETRAKEVRRIVEPLITLAIKEHANYTTETVIAKVPQKEDVPVKDADGKVIGTRQRRVKIVENGRKKTVYNDVSREIKKDNPSRLNARRKILSVLYPVTSVPVDGRRKRSMSKAIDLPAKMFDEIAPEFAKREQAAGGYTRMIKIGPRRGDAAEMVMLELLIKIAPRGDVAER